MIKQNIIKQSQYHQVTADKKHQRIADACIQKYNEVLHKQYKSVQINKVFGQYIHTTMFIYYLTANSGDKLTACINIFNDDPQNFPNLCQYVHQGYMKLMIAQKKLQQLDAWPSCGAYYRIGKQQICGGDLVIQHLTEINQKLGWGEQHYQIIRAWSQVVQGTNYFFHIQSQNGKKASVGMYVPLDYNEEDIDVGIEHKIKPQQMYGQEYQLQFEIFLCEKGFTNL